MYAKLDPFFFSHETPSEQAPESTADETDQNVSGIENESTPGTPELTVKETLFSYFEGYKS